MIKYAKFSEYYFHMNHNKYFQIYISGPLIMMTEKDIKREKSLKFTQF